MRQSSAYSARPSQAGSTSSQQVKAQLVEKCIEKKKEYDAVSALERSSAEYVNRLKALSKDCEVMADAGKVHGDVLAHWSDMFSLLELFVTTRNEGVNDSNASPPTTGERLVRVPIEALQQSEDNTNESTKER